MVLVVLTRFYIRAFVKAIVGIDDWIMGVAMVSHAKPGVPSQHLTTSSALPSQSPGSNAAGPIMAQGNTSGMLIPQKEKLRSR
jgi:hypothetical protein